MDTPESVEEIWPLVKFRIAAAKRSKDEYAPASELFRTRTGLILMYCLNPGSALLNVVASAFDNSVFAGQLNNQIDRLNKSLGREYNEIQRHIRALPVAVGLKDRSG